MMHFARSNIHSLEPGLRWYLYAPRDRGWGVLVFIECIVLWDVYTLMDMAPQSSLLLFFERKTELGSAVAQLSSVILLVLSLTSHGPTSIHLAHIHLQAWDKLKVESDLTELSLKHLKHSGCWAETRRTMRYKEAFVLKKSSNVFCQGGMGWQKPVMGPPSQLQHRAGG